MIEELDLLTDEHFFLERVVELVLADNDKLLLVGYGVVETATVEELDTWDVVLVGYGDVETGIELEALLLISC